MKSNITNDNQTLEIEFALNQPVVETESQEQIMDCNISPENIVSDAKGEVVYSLSEVQNISGDFELNVDGNFKINVSKHIILQSGGNPSDHDTNVLNSIWLNPTLDATGNPMVKEQNNCHNHRQSLSRLSRKLKRTKRRNNVKCY